MENINTEIINSIIAEMQEKNPSWSNYSYKIIASSSVDRSWSIDQRDLNQQNVVRGNTVHLLDFGKKIEEVFKNLNRKEKLNVLEFLFENKSLIEVRTNWDQSVHDEFEQYLPKSHKGKIKAWYLPTDTDELANEIIKDEMQLPKKEVQFDTNNLNIDKAFFELNKIVSYPNDKLWDGGFYSISNTGNSLSGTNSLYLFDNLEDKTNHQATQVDYKIVLNDDIKTLFNFVVRYYETENHSVPFDSIFVTVQNDGRYVVNFEFEGEEVSPAAPPMPETLTADYLCENLYNCLIDNAPDNFLWAWEIIKREKVVGGSSNIEGTFYYSLNTDKSNPQKLEPGEYIFMFNVTEQLFDNFIDKDLKNWTEVKLVFSNQGKYEFEVLKRS